MKIVIFVLILWIFRSLRKIIFPGKDKTEVERRKIRNRNILGVFILSGMIVVSVFIFRKHKQEINERVKSYKNSSRNKKSENPYANILTSDIIESLNLEDYFSSNGSNYSNSSDKANRDNRSNQMNPNNRAYGSSRNSGGGNQGLSRAAINNRSNQMNPNNSAYKGGKK